MSWMAVLVTTSVWLGLRRRTTGGSTTMTVLTTTTVVLIAVYLFVLK